MTLFINDKPIKIYSDSIPDRHFDIESNIEPEPSLLSGHVHISKASPTYIIYLLTYIQRNPSSTINTIWIKTSNEQNTKLLLRNSFIFIKAAGGVVKNDEGKLLMIKRLGKWDLPKGKAEKNESSETTAQREVEEECGVVGSIQSKCCSSWHMYETKKGIYLKRTKWYKMKLINDEKMQPQAEENIEEVKWMTENEMEEALENSYATIRYVIKKYKK